MIPNAGNKIGVHHIGQNWIQLKRLIWVIELQNTPKDEQRKKKNTTQCESEVSKGQGIRLFVV